MSEIQEIKGRKPNDDELKLSEYFAELRFGQVEFLDQAAKRIIELIGLMLSIIFGVIAFGADFPPSYLVQNMATRYIIVCAITLYLLAMLFCMLSLNPHKYSFQESNLTDMRRTFGQITERKSRRVFWGGTLFLGGSIMFGIMIIVIILGI